MNISGRGAADVERKCYYELYSGTRLCLSRPVTDVRKLRMRILSVWVISVAERSLKCLRKANKITT